MATPARKVLFQAISAVVLVAFVFVGVSLLFDFVRALVSAAALLAVVYLGWRVFRALGK